MLMCPASCNIDVDRMLQKRQKRHFTLRDEESVKLAVKHVDRASPYEGTMICFGSQQDPF